jgi:hypothetical protein
MYIIINDIAMEEINMETTDTLKTHTVSLYAIKVRDYTNVFIAQKITVNDFYSSEEAYVVIRGDGTQYIYQKSRVEWKQALGDFVITTPYNMITNKIDTFSKVAEYLDMKSKVACKIKKISFLERIKRLLWWIKD